MDDRDRSRDKLWCHALVDVLPIEDVNAVLGRFNSMRPDKKIQPDDDDFRKSDIKKCTDNLKVTNEAQND